MQSTLSAYAVAIRGAVACCWPQERQIRKYILSYQRRVTRIGL